MKAEGWRYTWHRWHYYRDGESLCGKYQVRIVGGTEPRRPWVKVLPDGESACETCKRQKNASDD